MPAEAIGEALSVPGVQTAYNQIKQANFNVTLSRGAQPDWVPDGTALKGFTNPSTGEVTIWLRNLESPDDLIATLVHESSHTTTILRRGVVDPDGVQAAEYAADLRAWIVTNGRKPTVNERNDILVDTINRISETGLYDVIQI